DADGDGYGDLAGVRARLDDLAALGVDAVWLTPFYPSPQADAGYDVADYRNVDPMFGSLDDIDQLIDELHGRSMRMIIDIVPNHTSSAHPWFQQALAARPGSAERSRYMFRDGRGPTGDLPPNNWTSEFGGSAWSRASDIGGTSNQWYLHLFAP
ncbi:MAG: alpha-amylase, partial [Ilumatobacteraceae bacterium]|nr:alpha-amylase [Ilumatobacteraceae bacterium]